MRIAVNTRFLQKDSLEGYGYFIYETVKCMAAEHPEHDFFLIFDRPYKEEYIFSKNITAIVVGPPARQPLLWKFWYDYKIPSVLKKIKADVFVSPDGFCSLRTKLPQVLVVHDLAFLHYPSFIKKSHLFFYKRYTPSFIHKAKIVATVSAFSKKEIIEHYQVPDEKIKVVYSAAHSIFKPISEVEQEKIKTTYAEGKSYFFYVGAIHPRKNLKNLLKAFSVFKKKQQSNMKLLIAGRLAWQSNDFSKSLETYKYRNDVVMLGYLPKDVLAKIMASAYALVYPSFFEGFGVPPIEAMKANVPVIVSNVSSMPEIAGNAGLYIDPSEYEDIAAKMILIYKDEELRQKLIDNGKSVAAFYDWGTTAKLLWNCIETALQ